MGLLTSLAGVWCEAASPTTDEFGSNTLTDNNSVGTAAGKVGTAAAFTAGTNNYLSHASNATFVCGDVDFWIGFWVKPTANTPQAVFVGKDVDSPANSRDYTIDWSAEALRFYVNGGAGGLLVSVSFTYAARTNVWSRVDCWHDSVGDTLNIAVDAGTPASVSTGGTAPQASSAEFRIGARAYSGFQDYATAQINQAALWKRVPTGTDLSSVYNSGSGLAFASWTGGAAAAPQLLLLGAG